MSILKSGKVGNIAFNRQVEERKLIKEAWTEIGLLKGLEGQTADNVAQLFENQANHMLNESTDTNGSTGSFEAVAFPLVRRVFSKLLANDIVSVQALSLSVGKIFYFNPKISTAPHTAYDGAYENAATQTNKTTFENRSLYDAYYGNTDFYAEDKSLFDRSKGNVTVKTATFDYTNKIVTIANLAGDVTGKIMDAEGSEIDTESFLSSLTVKTLKPLYVDAEKVLEIGSVIPYHLAPQTYTKSIADGGNVKIKLDLDVATATGYVLADNVDGAGAPIDATAFSVTYHMYDKMEENSEMGEVTFELESTTISVRSRKLRATWTPELAQDVMAYQNIDPEAELTNILSQTIASEIDREILRDLRNGAAWVSRWDYKGLKTQGSTYFGVQKDWNQTLITQINQIFAQIEKATLVQGTPWIVVSSEVSALFNDLEYFHVSNAAPDQNKYNLGIEKVGTLLGRYQVYKDNFAPSAVVLIGLKGSSILETGYVYAPYVPIALTPVFTDPRDFKQIRGITTRYGKKMINNRFYGKVLVDNIPTFNMNIGIN